MATKFEDYSSGGGDGVAWATTWYAQTFTPQTTHSITSVKLYLADPNGGSGTITVSIRETDEDGHPNGDDLCSGTLDSGELSSLPTYTWETITLDSNPELSADSKYAIVVRADFAMAWEATDPGGYTRGSGERSNDSGETWTTQTKDFWFEEWGDAYVFTPPTDVVTYRRLVAAANDKMWYESI